MANVRLTMRKIREVLRLHFECDRNQREIADAVGASTTTVWHYLRRMRLAGLSWPLPPELLTDDAALDARLYPPPARREPTRGMPDWPTVHREIGRKGVTLDLLWQEYKAQHPDGCGYSWFCKAYQEWAQRLPVTMRQTHVPGQKLFVFCGEGISVAADGCARLRSKPSTDGGYINSIIAIARTASDRSLSVVAPMTHCSAPDTPRRALSFPRQSEHKYLSC